MEQLPIDSYIIMLLCKQKNSISSINKSLVFNLIAVETENLCFYCIIIVLLYLDYLLNFSFYHSVYEVS